MTDSATIVSFITIGLQIGAERGLDGGDVFRSTSMNCAERAQDGGLEEIGVVESAEDGLRAFARNLRRLR